MPQRGYVSQPRVARNVLPWGQMDVHHNPNRGCVKNMHATVAHPMDRHNPDGVGLGLASQPQGRRGNANPGLWDAAPLGQKTMIITVSQLNCV